jgi:hypothetical protein
MHQFRVERRNRNNQIMKANSNADISTQEGKRILL